MPARPREIPSATSANVPTKQRAVYEALRTEILNGTLKPGEAMVIDSLAKRFQVSIIPVREALRQLQSERLVEITPHTGVRVTMVDAASLGEIFAMLGALEGISAVQCLPHLVEGGVLELEALLRKLENAAQKGDRAGFEEANREFHLLPCRIAGFTRVEQTLQSLLTEWERLHRSAFPLAQPPDMVAANRDHRDIVDALKRKDVEKLGPLLAQHNQTAVEHYQKFAEMLK